MGITNRDYYRQSNGGTNQFGSGPMSMSQKILIVTVVAFLLQVFLVVPTPRWRLALDYVSPQERAQYLEQAQELDREAYFTRQIEYVSVVEKWGAVIPRAVQRGEIWRLVTYAFLHSQEVSLHIVFNLMALWSFGPLLESIWGRREFLAFYLVAAISAGLCHVILGLAVGVPAGAVGASGSIMGLLMAFAVYYPRHLVSIFIFTLEARYLILLYVLFDGIPVLRMLGGSGAERGVGVAHAAHLGGLAFGFLYCTLGWRLTGWIDRWIPTRSRSGMSRSMPNRPNAFSTWWKTLFDRRPKLKLHTGPEEQKAEPLEKSTSESLERRVDQVLKKISEVGEANITEADRDVLREAARRYRRPD